jgi:hypothetical protein
LVSTLGKLHPKTLECQLDCAIAMIDLRRPGGEELLMEAEKQLNLILGEEHPSALYARLHSSNSERDLRERGGSPIESSLKLNTKKL